MSDDTDHEADAWDEDAERMLDDPDYNRGDEPADDYGWLWMDE